MTDKEGFGFDETSEPEAGERSPAAEEEPQLSPAPSAGKKSSPSRLFLLVVLLLVMAGAGTYFYLGGTPAPETPPPAPPAKQPIALPAPPAPEQPAVPPAGPAPVPAAPQKMEEATVVTERMSPPPPAAPSAPPEAVKASPKAAEPVPAAGHYVLEAGAFLLKSNLLEAQKQVRDLGFEPRVRSVVRPMPMTRLRVGVYPPAEAAARLKELAPLAPDAFLLKQGDEVAVYAASYANLDGARRFADLLYEQGVRVEEEPVQAEVPLSLLSFGDFADLEKARETAGRARAAGLEVFVNKRP